MKMELIQPFINAADAVLAETLQCATRIGDVTMEEEAYRRKGVASMVTIKGDIEGRIIFDIDSPTAAKVASYLSGGPVAESDAERLIVRPLHLLGARSIAWPAVRGTEQMQGGDRLIVYYGTPRGMRFVALNLNLVKGRREFLKLIDERLRAMGFEESVVDRSRYLSRKG